MEEKTIDKLKELFTKKVLDRIDRKILTYTVFVGIATVFWFLNELSNNYTSTINYPVRFTNIPKNKILVSDLPKRLKLNVNAYGYTLLRYKLSPASFPIVINLNDFAQNIGNPAIKKYRLHTRSIRQTVGKQMPNDIEVLDIFPDTVLFEFANIIEKRIPIKSNVQLEFDDECMLNGKVSFIPDSVTVQGPNNIIDTLTAIYNKFQRFDGLSKPLKRNVGLAEIKKLSYDKKRVVINLPVSKFTEAHFEVEVESRNVPDSLDLKIFPRLVKVKCLVALNDYDRLKAEDFKLDVDYSDIEKLLGDKLSLNLRFAPNNVKSVNYSPESVEFIIDKNLN